MSIFFIDNPLMDLNDGHFFREDVNRASAMI